MSRLRDRLLAGEHHGCANWRAAAQKLGVDERHLRVIRATLAAEGTPVGLGTSLAGKTYTIEIGESFNDELRRVRNLSGVPKAGTGSPSLGTRWPSLAEFDASTFRDEQAVHPPPYEPPPVASIRRLTQEDCPDGTLILWASDIHIPIHNEAACRLMVECAERIGVSRVVAGGDILDFNCLSTHPKEARRVVEHSTILEEVAPGRWLLDWMATKKTTLLLGNHENRLEKFVDENPVFYGSVLQNFAKVVELPPGIEVYPEDGEVQLGSLHLFHGSAEFKKSTGGPHPAARLLTMLPDQSSICGHLHRLTTACRTTKDEHGIPRTWRGWTMAHMSLEEFHRYAGKHPNWQTGFGVIRVFWLDGKPRFSVYQVEVLFDRYGKPYFELFGALYR